MPSKTLTKGHRRLTIKHSLNTSCSSWLIRSNSSYIAKEYSTSTAVRAKIKMNRCPDRDAQGPLS